MGFEARREPRDASRLEPRSRLCLDRSGVARAALHLPRRPVNRATVSPPGEPAPQALRSHPQETLHVLDSRGGYIHRVSRSSIQSTETSEMR